jgi:peptidoglycan/LPS O-acetylase OafA/YrhL
MYTVKTAVASGAGISNVYLWFFQEKGYFADEVRSSLLLHSWSLGVEEQFYMFLATIAYIASSCFPKQIDQAPKAVAGTVISLAFLSVSASAYMFEGHSSAVYYLLPFRISEMLWGSLGAVVVRVMANSPSKSFLSVIDWVSFVCFVFLVAGAFLVESSTAPTWIMTNLASVLSAIIVVGGSFDSTSPSSSSSIILGAPALSSFGRISYSFYLLHWPPIALLSYYGIVLSTWQVFAFFIVVTAASWVSFHLIEDRFQQLKTKGLIVLGIRLCAFILLLVLLQSFASTKIVKESVIPGTPAISTNPPAHIINPFISLKHDLKKVGTARLTERNGIGIRTNLRAYNSVGGDGRPAVNKAFALIGDSFAMQLFPLFDELGEKLKFKFQEFTSGSCPVFHSNTCDKEYEGHFKWEKFRAGCERLRARVWGEDGVRRFGTTVIAGSFGAYLPSCSKGISVLNETIRFLHHDLKQQVVLVGIMPAFLGYNAKKKNELVSKRLLDVNAHLKGIAIDQNVMYLSLSQYMCINSTCSSHDTDHKSRLFDSHHVTAPWMRSVARIMLKREPEPWLLKYMKMI